MAHTEIGRDLLLKFAQGCAETASMEKEPKLDGRHMSIFLAPKAREDQRKKPPKPQPSPEETKSEGDSENA